MLKVIHHIEALAKQLYDNENVNVPNGQNYSQRIPLPTDGHLSRVHQPVFPTLEPNLVSRIIEENHQNNVNSNNVHFSSSSQNKLVPLGQRLPGRNKNLSKSLGSSCLPTKQFKIGSKGSNQYQFAHPYLRSLT